MMERLQLSGVLPPVPTPFDDKGNADLDALTQNIIKLNTTGLAGFVVMGSNGEAVHLSPRERAAVIETARRAADQGSARTVVAGVNEHSTWAAIEATKQAAGLGADTALVVTPYFYKNAMTQAALSGHFLEVADASPVPVLIYNVPANTGVVIDSDTIASLSRHENIIGVKDSAGNMAAISATVAAAPDGFSVLCGNAGIFYPALAMGAAGGVLAVACIAPAACVELFKAATSGNHARARELQRRIAPVSQVITAGMGVPGLKAALRLAGYEGGYPRRPLLALSEVDALKIRGVMIESGLFPNLQSVTVGAHD
jgi:4-hydroxy-2-oxoglutarate aldolase